VKFTLLPKAWLLSFILFFHLFSLFSPANATVHSSFLNDQNLELTAICSGNGKIRWINLTDFYATGNITFVEPTSSTNNDTNKNNCQSCVCYSSLDNIDTALLTDSINGKYLQTSTRINFLTRNIKQTVVAPQSRDPPHFS